MVIRAVDPGKEDREDDVVVVCGLCGDDLSRHCEDVSAVRGGFFALKRRGVSSLVVVHACVKVDHRGGVLHGCLVESQHLFARNVEFLPGQGKEVMKLTKSKTVRARTGSWVPASGESRGRNAGYFNAQDDVRWFRNLVTLC